MLIVVYQHEKLTLNIALQDFLSFEDTTTAKSNHNASLDAVIDTFRELLLFWMNLLSHRPNDPPVPPHSRDIHDKIIFFFVYGPIRTICIEKSAPQSKWSQ